MPAVDILPSPRRLKRERLCEDEELQPLIQDVALSFKDGNVTIVAQNVAFRVHQGVLSRHSEAFRAMFSTSQHAFAVEHERVDGCPVIHVPHSAHDIRHLLHALYDGLDTYLQPGRPVKFSVLAALVRLSHKYQLDRIFAITLGLMKVVFTNEFEAWRVRESRLCSASAVQFQDTDAIEGYNLLRACGRMELLPVALHACCALDVRTLIRGFPRADGTLEKLSNSDLERCLSARDTLEVRNAALNRAVFDFAAPSRRPCLSPSICPLTLHNVGTMAGLGTRSETEARRLVHRILATTDTSAVCNSCSSFITSSLAKFYEDLWRDLPKILDLPVSSWPSPA